MATASKSGRTRKVKVKPAASAPAADISVQWTGSTGRRIESRKDARTTASLAREAPWWNYALLNRERWRDTEFLNVEQESRARSLWNDLFDQPLFDSSPQQQDLPEAIEVAVSSRDKDHNWHCRVMPWEFMINSVLRTLVPKEESERGERRIPVLRRWAGSPGKSTPRTLEGTKWRVLVVLSAPGFIGAEYKLRTERDLLLERLFDKPAPGPDAPAQPDPPGCRTVWNPTFQELQAAITTFEPDIVHVAGCDSHQAVALADRPELAPADRRLRMEQLGMDPDVSVDLIDELDGFAMLDKQAHPERARTTVGPNAMHGTYARIRLVDWDKLPGLFGGRRPPALVCWNLYNSANRIAALTVGQGGVGASIGFQDFIDDDVAEEYFDEFYRGLRATGGAIGVAHVRGLKAAWRTKQLNASGIVCWTGPSRVPEFSRSGKSRGIDPTDIVLARGKANVRKAVAKLGAVVKLPKGGLNYAQLHQRQYSAFSSFRLLLAKPHRLEDVEVEVHLNGEDRELAYRGTFDVDAPFLDLRDKIRFPLTSPLARSCRESVVTTLSVQVKYDGDVLHSETYATRLLPADQWRFSTEHAHTLASFVFPRDAAVEKLVLAAQKYVRVLRDDAYAGFEGYQTTDPAGVDLQVRALWSALLHEYRLGYINPPPAYSHEQDSQRLRTPSAVLRGGWGTCVDLALLLAAALELVDIYPTIFVLQQHAFAGYWRSTEARDKFIKVEEAVDSWQRGVFSTRRPVNGMFLSASLEEIRKYIDAGDLVVLEATFLTNGGSFEDAKAQGVKNLDDPAEFEYMVDLLSARVAQITPLPLASGEKA